MQIIFELFVIQIKEWWMDGQYTGITKFSYYSILKINEIDCVSQNCEKCINVNGFMNFHDSLCTNVLVGVAIKMKAKRSHFLMFTIFA